MFQTKPISCQILFSETNFHLLDNYQTSFWSDILIINLSEQFIIKNWVKYVFEMLKFVLQLIDSLLAPWSINLTD